MRAASVPRAFPADALTALVRGEPVAWRTFGVTSAEFLEVCADEDLIGLVHQRLCERPDQRDWPDTLCAEVAKQARGGAARELVRREELISVLGALVEAGVGPILLKGTPLAYSVYGAPALRPRQDTDLIVRRDALDAVARTMTDLGYTAPPYCDGERVFGQFALEKEDRLGVEHAFDFHWKISTQSVFADLLTYDELAADAAPIPALGASARAAGPVHALLLACLHPVMHHRNVERLIWVYDIHLLASRLSAAEFQRFSDLAVDRGVGAICARQLAHARSRFGTRMPEGLLPRLAAVQSEASAVYLRPGRRWHHEFASSVRGLPRWHDRIRLMREVLLPSPRYMLGAYGLTSRPVGLALLPALYVHRNVHGIWKVLVGRK
jgi:hypothetical protein